MKQYNKWVSPYVAFWQLCVINTDNDRVSDRIIMGLSFPFVLTHWYVVDIWSTDEIL